MTTNNAIKGALFAKLETAALGYPIAWPGVDFTPPDSGAWLEVSFFPNEGIDNGLRYADELVPQGLLQVECVTRPGGGSFALGTVSAQVHAVYPKGEPLVDQVRVIRHPYDMELDPRDDRMSIVVTVEYSG